MFDPFFTIIYCTIDLANDKPRNLTVANITSRSAEISWLKPKNHGRYYRYYFRITLEEKGKSIRLSKGTRPSKVNKYKLDNLIPFTTYEIYVATIMSYLGGRGYSEESITSFVTLEEGTFFIQRI